MRTLVKILLWHVMPLHWWGAAIGAAASLLGSAKSGSQSEGLAKYQLDYQRDLANSAHVRQVQDLANAGLNPILSAKYGGAGNVSTAGANIPDYGRAAGAGVQAYSAQQTARLQKAQTAQSSETAQLVAEQQNTEKVRQNQLAQQAARENAQASKNMQEYHTERARTESENLRLAERRAENMFWRQAQGYGKAMQSAKGLSDIYKGLKAPKIFKGNKR